MRFASLSVSALRHRLMALLGLCVLAAAAHAQAVSPEALAAFEKSTSMGAFVGSAQRDPLENMYGNTVVCAAAQTGQDLCHLWLERDGTFINFDSNGAHTGHYTVGPVRADGKVPVCQYWDTTNMIAPKEMGTDMPGAAPPAAATGSAPSGATSVAAGMGAGGMTMVCKNENHRTTCMRGVDPDTLSEEEKKRSQWTMAERFYNGMCYPLGGHQVGDVWYEFDDPLPGQLGLDKMFLLPGHQ